MKRYFFTYLAGDCIVKDTVVILQMPNVFPDKISSWGKNTLNQYFTNCTVQDFILL